MPSDFFGRGSGAGGSSGMTIAREFRVEFAVLLPLWESCPRCCCGGGSSVIGAGGLLM
jgi:hypothetical protein